MRSAVLLMAACAMLSPALAATRRPAVAQAASFTVTQASEGARIYAVRCAMCHGATLRGNLEMPGLTGKFMANWAGRPVGSLFDYVSRAMPQPAPGSISAADNARVVAFLLQANGVKPGSTALPTEPGALQRMTLLPVAPQ